MFSKLVKKLKYKLLLSKIRPEITGYTDGKGETVRDSGASNMSHISNKKNITIGENVFIGHFNYIDGYMKVSIGEGCQITNYVSILTHSSHNSIRLHGKNYNEDVNALIGLKEDEVKIGAYTYIGAHCVVMPGSNIGKGCIIGAFSYIDGEVPDFSILRGQPAKVIGDTRLVDEKYLNEFPDLEKSYYLKDV